MDNMKVPEFLFFLINSLTQAEKRYFKMNSNFQIGEGSKKLYIKMFDAIDKMEKYRDGDLLKYAGGNKQKLSSRKNYLYGKILHSLRAYNESSSVDIELYNLVVETKILMGKGLFLPALKQLKKAKKMVIKYKKSLLLAEIIDLEIDIIAQIAKKNRELQFKELFDEAIDTLEKYTRAIQMKRLSRELHSELGETSELKEYIDKINGLPDSVDKLKSFHAKSYYHNALAHYSRLTENKQEHGEQLKARVELWRKHPNIIKTHTQQYRIYLSNYTISRVVHSDYEKIDEAIEEIEQLDAKSNYEKASRFQNVEYIKLLYYIRINKFYKAAELASNIEKKLIVYRGLIDKGREVSIYRNMIIVYLALEDYKQAAKWINKILYYQKLKTKGQVRQFAWIFEIIIHNKLKNDEVIKTIYKSADFPLNHPNPHPFEVLCFKHLKKITSALTGRKTLYGDFKKDLDEYALNNRHFGLDVLSIWIESNITNLSFEEVLRKRLNPPH